MLKIIKHYFYHKYLRRKLKKHHIRSWVCTCGITIEHPQIEIFEQCKDINCPVCIYYKNL